MKLFGAVTSGPSVRGSAVTDADRQEESKESESKPKLRMAGDAVLRSIVTGPAAVISCTVQSLETAGKRGKREAPLRVAPAD